MAAAGYVSNKAGEHRVTVSVTHYRGSLQTDSM